MAKKIEIYENTLLKLLVRRGIDIDRKNVVLSEGELGFTTDNKKLYVGDGQTPGGIFVGGNTVLNSVNDIVTLSTAIEGDLVYSPNTKTLYRFGGGDYTDINNWEAVAVTYNVDGSTIKLDGNTLRLGILSAGSISADALGDSLTLDNTGKITLDSPIIIDSIATSDPNVVLSLPGNLKINDVEYNWPGGVAGDTYLSTDVSGNLSWKPLTSTTTVLATTTASQMPVGSIVPFVSSVNVPYGWLLCNGQSVLRTEYADLFNVIGTTYGSTASSTFKLPNLVNKTLYGVQNTPSTSTVYNLASSQSISLSATGMLFLMKSVVDPIASATLTIASPLTCSVDGIDQTSSTISPYTGDIVIGMPPVRNISGSSSYRNKAINGNFDIWQRDTTTVNSPVSAITRSRTADRWRTFASGINNAMFSVARQPCALTESDYFNANYYQRLTYKNGVGSSSGFTTLEQYIDSDTDINIIGDSSGSMNSTLNVLNAMVSSGALKARLLPYYNNNETLYNQRVKYFSDSGERTFQTYMLNKAGRGGSRLINLVFQDEADSGYYTNSNPNGKAAAITDITALRTTLAGYATGYFTGIVFRVTGYNSFKTFLQNVKLGLGNFTAVNLVDKPEVQFQYDVTEDASQQYYVDVIENAILSLNTLTSGTGTPSYGALDRGDVGALAIQNLENAAEILGKEVTLSFWARASQPTKIFSESQIHSSDLESMFTPAIHKVFDLSTSWQKFTHTYIMPTFQQVSAVAYDATVFANPIPEVPTYTPLHLSNSLPPLSSWLYQVDIKTHWTKRESIRHGNAWSGTTSYRPGSAVNYPGEAMTPAELIAISTSVLSGSQGYYDIAQIQLEEGNIATDFEFKPAGLELATCQRYYEIGGVLTPDIAGSNSRHHLCTVGSQNHAGWQFTTTKCKVPTVNFWRPSLGKTASTGFIENTAESNPVAIGTIGRNVYGITYFSTPETITSNSHTGGLMEIGWEADAEI